LPKTKGKAKPKSRRKKRKLSAVILLAIAAFIASPLDDVIFLSVFGVALLAFLSIEFVITIMVIVAVAMWLLLKNNY
jgi:hypothetical protein